jgi:hypothetical protein
MAHTLPVPEAVDATTGQVHHFTPVHVPEVTGSAGHVQSTATSAVQYQPVEEQQQQQQPVQQPTHQPTPTRPQPRRVPTAVITRPGEDIPPVTEPETQSHSRDLPPSAVSHTVHVPNTSDTTDTTHPTNQTSVVPATAAHAAPDHALPTAPTVHPEAQAAELDAVGARDPGLVAAQVEKSKGDRRELKGLEPKGTVVQGIEDDKLWALLRRFDVVRRLSLFPAP